MRLAIIGSRNCPSLDILRYIKKMPTAIVSGGARGADLLAREFALKFGIKLFEYLPDYRNYPPRIAPLKRNKEIVNNCDCLLAFWDGISRGTAYTINLAIMTGKPTKVVNFKTGEIKYFNINNR